MCVGQARVHGASKQNRQRAGLDPRLVDAQSGGGTSANRAFKIVERLPLTGPKHERLLVARRLCRQA